MKNIKLLQTTNYKLRANSGFTLIEMLIVVAIVGILSAASLVALGPSRDKAKDSRIIQEINQIRALAETFYNGNYDALEEISIDTDYSAIQNADLRSLVTDISTQGGQVIIAKSDKPANNFVAYSRLNVKVGPTESQQTNYYCVDNRGKSIITLTPEENIQYGKIECPSN